MDALWARLLSAGLCPQKKLVFPSRTSSGHQKQCSTDMTNSRLWKSVISVPLRISRSVPNSNRKELLRWELATLGTAWPCVVHGPR